MEKLSPEEFFERARKGEFMGAQVTIVPKPIVFIVKESELEDAVWGDDARWFVGDDNFGMWEDCCDTFDHLIVKEKSNG
jgi:hypothetical protein